MRMRWPGADPRADGGSASLYGHPTVLLDEAQDLSPFHHALLKLAYPRAAFTLLADVNQNIFPYAGLTHEQDFSAPVSWRRFPG